MLIRRTWQKQTGLSLNYCMKFAAVGFLKMDIAEHKMIWFIKDCMELSKELLVDF